MVHRGITYRLIPRTKARARQLACLAGACRYVWNQFLGENQLLLAAHQAGPANNPKPSTSFFSFGQRVYSIKEDRLLVAGTVVSGRPVRVKVSS